MEYPELLAKCDSLQEALDKVYERLDNIVAANGIPMPADIQLLSLKQCTESLRDDLRPYISYDPA